LVGSTGSIGTNALDVIAHLADRLQLLRNRRHRNLELFFRVIDSDEEAQTRSILCNRRIHDRLDMDALFQKPLRQQHAAVAIADDKRGDGGVRSAAHWQSPLARELSEAIVTLPKEVPSGGTVELTVGYEGVIELDATRLTRIGLPQTSSIHSDWDVIGKTFSAVRWIGYVTWYPVAIDAGNLSEGNSLFEPPTLGIFNASADFDPAKSKITIARRAESQVINECHLSEFSPATRSLLLDGNNNTGLGYNTLSNDSDGNGNIAIGSDERMSADARPSDANARILRRILKRSRMTAERFCRISPRLPPVEP
jgi:hypothetical protein